MPYLFNLISSFFSEGISLMALLKSSAKNHPMRIALISEGQRLTYTETYEKATRLAAYLHHHFNISKGQRIALLCRNHEWSSLLLAATSRLGASVMLLNTDASAVQVEKFLAKGTTDVLFYDEEYATSVTNSTIQKSYSIEHLTSCFYTAEPTITTKIPRIFRGGNITVFTGGSSGNYKSVTRKSSVFQFLPPLLALMKDIRIYRYSSVLIPLPFYHGFGLATFAVSLFLGKKICLLRHFNAEEAVRLTNEEHIEVLPVVPAMLSRMMHTPNAYSLMKSVRCIICGGDILEKHLVQNVHENLGNVLFNLYGTTETGFFMIASPKDLAANDEMTDEVTLGRPITGVRCQLQDCSPDGVGTLAVKPSFFGNWIVTGDRVSRNSVGYYFYRGRADNMVVCGGENVYPENLQRALNEHPDIIDSLVFPVPHPDFGRVLHAQVELTPSSSLSPSDIQLWLKSRVSRAEMPHHITIAPITVLSTGKRTHKEIH